MNQTTKKLLNHLEDTRVRDKIERLLQNPGRSSRETSMEEAYKSYQNNRELLLQSIKKGTFDELPYNFRKRISTLVVQHFPYTGSPTEFIIFTHELEELIHNSRLWEKNSENVDVEDLGKEIVEFPRHFEDLKDQMEQVYIVKGKFQKLLSKYTERAEKQRELLEEKANAYQEMKVLQKKTEFIYDRISKNDQEIENKKKDIIAFHNSTNLYRKEIESALSTMENKVSTELNSNIQRAKDLISEAENALELKSTQGISMAYSSRLEKLNKDWSKGWWLAGAVVFLIITILLGLMLTGFTIGDWSWGETDNEAVIIGRIAMSGIGITAAVFCAKRYLYLKNLEEDYEYKVVLTKSILAFANKLKEIDDTRVAEYLNKVLNELLQDPSRKSNDNKPLDNKLIVALESLSKRRGSGN